MKIIKIFTLFLILTFLMSCGKSNTITYNVNGGVMPEGYQESFNVEDNYRLPIPTKEGFFFVGWTEDGKYVDKLEERNYNLEAIWIESIDYDYIEDSEIYLQPEQEYLVYFMRDGCSWCAKIKDDVLRYQYKTTLEQYSNNIKLYIVNLKTSERRSKILREYTGDDGDRDNFYVNKALKWDELYIPSTPSLIKITTNNNVRNSALLESGATKIKNKLFDYLCDEKDYSLKTNKITINFDLNGGVMSEELSQEGYPWTFIDLPFPSKEGFTFIGWYDGENLVDVLESKDYNLVAKWQETIETKFIKKEEIFTKLESELEYYVLFLKYSHNKEDYIYQINQYNTFALKRGYPIVYIIDFEDCQEIYRTYESSENGMFVDQATEWNELYISDGYTLIHLMKENDEKQARYTIKGLREVLNYLNEKYSFSTK